MAATRSAGRSWGTPEGVVRVSRLALRTEELLGENSGTVVAETLGKGHDEMPKRKTASQRRGRSAARGSWLALVAATTLGDGVDTLRAEVRADGLTDGDYRLVVQSYHGKDGRMLGRRTRPIGSAQRTVTADELRAGVQVPVLEVRERAVEMRSEAPYVVAWVEAGGPDLEFDGLTARPRPGSVYGVVRRAARQDAVQISLNRTVAA